VRQNLLSLQSTADLLATTQNRLATGKKVNTALDNPTNFFTAQSLDGRASDISNLLDGISNGVQILQAANTGITSLQKLVDSAKSVANQALQTTVGYSTKSNVSATIAGATAADLRGTTTFTNAVATSNVLYSGAAGGLTAAIGTSTLGGVIGTLAGSAAGTTAYQATAGTAGTALHVGTGGATASGASLINALTDGSSATLTGPTAGNVLTINGHTLTFTASGAAATDANGNITIGVDQAVSSLLTQINTLSGGTSAISGGQITLTTGTSADIAITDNASGAVLTALGLGAAGAHNITRTTGSGGAITGSTKLFSTTGGLSTTANFADNDVLNVNGHTITFKALALPTGASIPTGYGTTGNIATDGNGNSIVYLGTSSTTTSATVSDVLNAIDLASGVQSATIASGAATLATNAGQTASSVAAGAISLKTSTGADLNISGKADSLKALGLTSSTGAGTAVVTANRTTSSATLGALIADGSTLNVNGKIVTFKNAATPTAGASHTGVTGNIETDGNGNSTVYLQSATINDVLNAIDIATGTQTATLSSSGATLATATGGTKSSIVSGALKLSTGTANDLAITATGNALSALGLNGPTANATSFNASRTAGAGGINGQTLTFTSFNGGTAVNVTFGDGTGGTVKTLDQLNAKLLTNNLTATLDSTGKLTITSTNDYASSTLGSVAAGGAIGGTVTSAISWSTASAPVVDVAAQTVRSNLVNQYNNILQQITTTAQDSSYNGVNLLYGDQLKLTFNETGKSTLNITGVTFNAAGLGLANLTSGTDFIDNAATNTVVSSLNAASTLLRSQASTLGSNLSVVQIRQDFSKNLINVLQTGSSNLTLADTNEEAANSQALSTRQSIAVSALALANQSQQSVLQLLR
jgi:flagellin-like hook-associated protein FlgL